MPIRGCFAKDIFDTTGTPTDNVREYAQPEEQNKRKREKDRDNAQAKSGEADVNAARETEKLRGAPVAVVNQNSAN